MLSQPTQFPSTMFTIFTLTNMHIEDILMPKKRNIWFMKMRLMVLFVFVLYTLFYKNKSFDFGKKKLRTKLSQRA